MRRYKIVNYEVKSDKIPSAFDGYRFVFLSDLHNNEYSIDLNKLCEDIFKINPDSIIMAGDMFTGDSRCNNNIAASFIENLGSYYTIFYGHGNHEYRMKDNDSHYPGMYKYFEETIKKSKAILLENESIEIKKDGQSIKIYGLSIDTSFYKKFKKVSMKENYVASKLGNIDSTKFNILIAHNPEYFDKYAKWGADLSLSGHMHGGMARLPIIGGVMAPSYRLMPKYDRGMFEIGQAKMILSAGIGTHTINLRPFNPPEMIVITLKN